MNDKPRLLIIHIVVVHRIGFMDLSIFQGVEMSLLTPPPLRNTREKYRPIVKTNELSSFEPIRDIV